MGDDDKQMKEGAFLWKSSLGNIIMEWTKQCNCVWLGLVHLQVSLDFTTNSSHYGRAEQQQGRFSARRSHAVKLWRIDTLSYICGEQERMSRVSC